MHSKIQRYVSNIFVSGKPAIDLIIRIIFFSSLILLTTLHCTSVRCFYNVLLIKADSLQRSLFNLENSQIFAIVQITRMIRSEGKSYRGLDIQYLKDWQESLRKRLNTKMFLISFCLINRNGMNFDKRVYLHFPFIHVNVPFRRRIERSK